MRRSLRKIDVQEVTDYAEQAQLFTALSLEQARERLRADGLDPANYCFHTWMRAGVRYYRVWEDKRLAAGIVQVVPFGRPAVKLKRAEAEKLYTIARRFTPAEGGVRFIIEPGFVRILNGEAEPVATVSVPVVGGDLVFIDDVPGGWRSDQIAHFLNVMLVRGHGPERAYAEASELQA